MSKPLPHQWLPGADAENSLAQQVQENFDALAIQTNDSVSAAQALTLQNSWVDYGAPFATARYVLDSAGVVHLRGTIKNGSSAAAAIAVLPAGVRPAATRDFASVGNGFFAQIRVAADGTVNSPNGDAARTAQLSLDGVSFKAGQ